MSARPICFSTDAYYDAWSKERIEAWHATYNAALAGLLARGRGATETTLTAGLLAAQCANDLHGAIPRVGP